MTFTVAVGFLVLVLLRCCRRLRSDGFIWLLAIILLCAVDLSALALFLLPERYFLDVEMQSFELLRRALVSFTTKTPFQRRDL